IQRDSARGQPMRPGENEDRGWMVPRFVQHDSTLSKWGLGRRGDGRSRQWRSRIDDIDTRLIEFSREVKPCEPCHATSLPDPLMPLAADESNCWAIRDQLPVRYNRPRAPPVIIRKRANVRPGPITHSNIPLQAREGTSVIRCLIALVLAAELCTLRGGFAR